MATLNSEELLFLSDEQGDEVSTDQVVLDKEKPPYAISVIWMPVTELWLCTVKTLDGVPLVTGVAMNHREDVLANVVMPERPAGALVPASADGLSLRRDAWYTGARLYYIPAGLDALLEEAVAQL